MKPPVANISFTLYLHRPEEEGGSPISTGRRYVFLHMWAHFSRPYSSIRIGYAHYRYQSTFDKVEALYYANTGNDLICVYCSCLIFDVAWDLKTSPTYPQCQDCAHKDNISVKRRKQPTNANFN